MVSPNTRRNLDADPNDLYETSREAVELAIKAGVFDGIKSVYDPCDGLGGITNVLEELLGIRTIRSDKFVYEGTSERTWVVDFLLSDDIPDPYLVDALVMNPPYKLTYEFVDKATDVYDKVIMFNRINFLETYKRSIKMHTREWNLKTVYIHADRVGCAKPGEKAVKAVMYAWYVFDKNNRNLNPEIKWIFRDE